MIGELADPDQPRRKSPRLPGFGYEVEDNVYLVTVRAKAGLAPFAEPQLAQVTVEALLYQRQIGRVRIFAYVLMPDHLHIAMGLGATECSLIDVMRDFKTYTTRQAWRCGLRGELWQRSYHDHTVRREEDLRRICEYILANPVRKSLVAESDDWPYLGMPDPFLI